jgi:SAM-dependent methyltransferase
MKFSHLTSFYEQWSRKDERLMAHDIQSGFRKATVMASNFPVDFLKKFTKIMDFGCGYGSVLKRFVELNGDVVKSAVGVDFSQVAIDVARNEFESEKIKFYKLPSLNIGDYRDYLDEIIKEDLDCIILADLLEHVPDCISLLRCLSQFTDYFAIKLPVEFSIFDNFFMRKEYPSLNHSNGHLREFDANSVHYFIRKIGLTPVYECLYIYDIDDSCPPPVNRLSAKSWLKYKMLRFFKTVSSKVLPKRIYMYFVGGGGYICIAKFEEDAILIP